MKEGEVKGHELFQRRLGGGGMGSAVVWCEKQRSLQ